MAASTTKNFHLPLPVDTYRDLRRAAERLGEPTTSVARTATSECLDRQRKFAVEEGIAEYAIAVAGSRDDLDPDFERAGIEVIVARAKRTARNNIEIGSRYPMSSAVGLVAPDLGVAAECLLNIGEHHHAWTG